MPLRQCSFLLVSWTMSLSPTTSAFGEGRRSRTPDDLSRPYRYVSLEGLSDEEIVAFMGQGNSFYDLERRTRPRNRVPDGFWQLDPKAAALALVEANRSEPHRRQFGISLDEREGPPENCTIHLVESPVGMPEWQTRYFVRCAPEDSFLACAWQERFGSDSWDSLHVEGVYDLRHVRLDYDRARKVVQVIWWLRRISANRLCWGGSRRHCCSGDGEATLDLAAADGRTLFRISGRSWGGFRAAVSGRWSRAYEDEVPLNLAGHVVTAGLIERLGERWTRHGEPRHGGLYANSPEGFEYSDQGVERTRKTARWFLERFARDDRAFPVEFAEIAVKAAGEMGLVGLERSVRRLERSLSKPRRGEAGADGLDELREDVRVALRKLRCVNDAGALAAWAASRKGDYIWAVRHLRKLDRKRYLEILDRWAEKEEGKRLRHIYEEFKRLDPARAKALVGAGRIAEKVKAALSAVERAKLIEDEKERVAALVAVALDPAHGWSRRSKAIHLLVPWKEPLRHADPSVDEALVRLLDTLWGEEDGEYVADDVFEALARRRRREHFDRMLERLCKFERYSHFGDALKAVTDLARMAGAKERAALAGFLRPQLRSTKMDINHIIRSAWQADLRELRPDLERIATSGPDDYEGDKTFRFGGEPSSVEHRYHLARKVVSVWNEENPLTRAKLLTAFARENYWHMPAEGEDYEVNPLRAGLAALAAEFGPVAVGELEAFLDWLERGRNYAEPGGPKDRAADLVRAVFDLPAPRER